ncbi:MAG: Radical SAM domain protein [Candidatus Woesebacteria bacterium GW2011_GWB1_43_14]|uniref:Radical SAM domain protein n=1 Tax=Candidatus Woesebacteria bacterium GW2011_GWB1_43_14 TaxID=1618578 RepID=A0A0G1DHQ8_9BACT|nr:MAG: Radical SAM domain protein [Candidatus Woesebacteria bacterium GW2011_GWA1_39_11b]KKS78358.1 MAG: Radical SAM domain protein [Candidatus Woesebacteria bacterium GW2011_GWC1_42_9]KKS97224.1 MAG: Radical SAM domain protein [Candidatus Woesebacteria bacterium GW2011_GWB1_43_14]
MSVNERLVYLGPEKFPSLESQKDKVRDIPVCIIIPPSTFLADERVFPFLGALKIAAELERNGNPIKVLDLSGHQNYLDIIDQYVSQNGRHVFGITATTPQIPATMQIAERIKTISPESHIILGGPHATLTHTAMKEDIKFGAPRRGTRAFEQLTKYVDKIVVGDGEAAIFYAIDPDYLDNIVDAGNNKSPLFLAKGTLDQYAWPARHLIDHESYKYYITDQGQRYRTFSVISQLGCPFGCGFCGGRKSQVFRMARQREIGNTIDEIRQVIIGSKNWAEPLRGVMFYDDELNINPGTLENLCLGLIKMQKELGIEMRFRGFIKAELFTSEQAELMYKAGFRVVLSGVESGSDQMLRAMNKGTSRETNARCVNLAHQAGLRFKALMSIGHPGESSQTVEESIDWVVNNLKHGDEIDWTIITQYPGTPYYDESIFIPEKKAWVYTIADPHTHQPLRLWSDELNYAKDTNFYKGIPGDYTAYIWTDHLNPQELVVIRDHAERTTRKYLQLPEIQTVAARQFEHSMGQGLPSHILRSGNS